MTATKHFHGKMPLGWNDAPSTLRSESAQTPRNNSSLQLTTCLNAFSIIIIITTISIARAAREGEAKGQLRHKDEKQLRPRPQMVRAGLANSALFRGSSWHAGS